MKQFNFILPIIAVFMLISGFRCGDCCGPCEEVVCESYLSILFVSKTDSSDLFINGTYQADSLQLFALHSDATTIDYSHQLRVNRYSDYTYLGFYISKDAVAYIFQFNSQERDTLSARYTSLSSDECCDEVTNFTYSIFRGDTILPNANGNLILKK